MELIKTLSLILFFKEPSAVQIPPERPCQLVLNEETSNPQKASDLA